MSSRDCFDDRAYLLDKAGIMVNLLNNVADIDIDRETRTMKWRQWATKALFFIAGFGVAAWAPLVPFIKIRFSLAEDTLGLLLLCIGLGSAVAMPLAGVLAGRFGCRKVLGFVGGAYALILLSLSLITNMTVLVIALLIFGATMGVLDVVVNLHAVLVEKQSGKRLMSGMHGLWSVGGFLGSAVFSALMYLGLSPATTTLSIVFIMLIVLRVFVPYLLSQGDDAPASAIFVAPKGIVAVVGALCAISFLVEGAVLDWGGVFLTSIRDFDLSKAGFAYAAFSGAMLIARLLGDRIVRQLGEKKVVIGGALVAGSGFLLAILVPISVWSLVGFSLVGAGAANIVPVFYSLLGRQKIMPISAAVSAVTAIGYLGILMGPALIGFVAYRTSLTLAFTMLAGLFLAQAAAAKYVFRAVR